MQNGDYHFNQWSSPYFNDQSTTTTTTTTDTSLTPSTPIITPEEAVRRKQQYMDYCAKHGLTPYWFD